MMRRVKIVFQWSQERRANLSPKSQRFVLPARFDHQRDDWKKDAWSLAIEVEGTPDESGKQNGITRFLVPNASQHWLSEGQRFTLFEGALSVGVGTVKEVLPDETP